MIRSVIVVAVVAAAAAAAANTAAALSWGVRLAMVATWWLFAMGEMGAPSAWGLGKLWLRL